MHSTPWLQTSDRRPFAGKKKKAKFPVEPLPSSPVRELSDFLAALLAAPGNAKDPAGGCFCSARVHSLSKYVPICTTCGLVLCELNLSYYACPHCFSAISTKDRRAEIAIQVEHAIEKQRNLEAEERELVEIQAKRAVGDFPTLVSAGGSVPVQAKTVTSLPLAQTQKVMHLNSKSKKVTISSYAPHLSRPSPSLPPAKEDISTRVPAPPREPPYTIHTADIRRRWKNWLVDDVHYVPPVSDSVQTDGRSAKKGNRKNPAHGASKS